MGAWKEWGINHQQLKADATELAVRTGALKRCWLHSDFVLTAGNQDGERAAYALGTHMVKAGEVRGSREEFMDAIKEAIAEAALECPACASL